MLDDAKRLLATYSLLCIVVTVGAGYLAGRCSGRTTEKLAANANRIAVASTHRTAAEQHRQQAEARGAKAKAHRDSIKPRVIVTSDSTADVDHIPIVLPLPVVSLLRADDRQAKMDSLTIVALRLENATLREELDAWKERAQILEKPRCGFKCGLLAGAGLVAGIASLVK